jgi:hypothetical protein
MTVDERITLIGVKIERAEKHIEDLYPAVQAYLATRPYVISSQVQAHPRPHRIYYLAEVKPVPDHVRAIAGDILFNVRAALDHLAYQLVTVRGFVNDQGAPLSEGEKRDIYFPILDVETAEEYITAEARKRKVKGMSQVARDAIDRTKPYKGGNKTLWRLHKLHNIDKHRLVVAAASAPHSIDDRRLFENARSGYVIDPNLVLDPRHLIGPAKEGQAVYIDQINPKADQQIQPYFQVVLHEPGIVECEPLLETIHYMVEHVKDIVSSFKPLLV